MQKLIGFDEPGADEGDCADVPAVPSRRCAAWRLTPLLDGRRRHSRPGSSQLEHFACPSFLRIYETRLSRENGTHQADRKGVTYIQIALDLLGVAVEADHVSPLPLWLPWSKVEPTADHLRHPCGQQLS